MADKAPDAAPARLRILLLEDSDIDAELLLAYITEIADDPQPLGCSELGWFDAGQIGLLATPAADVPISTSRCWNRSGGKLPLKTSFAEM